MQLTSVYVRVEFIRNNVYIIFPVSVHISPLIMQVMQEIA